MRMAIKDGKLPISFDKFMSNSRPWTCEKKNSACASCKTYSKCMNADKIKGGSR